MKTFQSSAAQGDLYIRRIQVIPKDAVLVQPENGQYIVAHSETGHHHVVEERPNIKLYKSDDPLVSYLEVIEATDKTEALLKHLRPFDTHETLGFPVGKFSLHRQREYTPEGWRMVAD